LVTTVKSITILGLVFGLLIIGGVISGCGSNDDENGAANNTIMDSDFDGLSNQDEVGIFKTDPAKYDTDADGLSDGAEVSYDGNDSLFTVGSDTDPNNPDTDGDGVKDGAEVVAGTNPLDPASH